MWKNIFYRIQKLEQENARLKKIISENTDWFETQDEDEEYALEDENDNDLEAQEKPNGQKSGTVLTEGKKKRVKYKKKKRLLDITTIVDENKKLISTSVVHSEFGEGTIYHISNMGRINVLFTNGEEHDFPYNAFALGLLKRKP